MLVTLAVVALALDAVDGWVARRTGTASPLGARFDGEVDAFLILVLSVYVARSAGAWVLAIGAARYAFLAAGWLLPWMREPLPPRYWRKVVAATQGIVADGRGRGRPAAGSDPGRPRSSRLPCSPSRSAATCGGCGATGTPRTLELAAIAAEARAARPPARRGRVRTGIAAVLTILAAAARLGRPRRSGPAGSSHARRVRAAPARGPRRPRARPRPARRPRGASWPGSSGRCSACW